MLIGYARVSTHEQNLDLQADAVAGVEAGPTDKTSGYQGRAARPGARHNRSRAPAILLALDEWLRPLDLLDWSVFATVLGWLRRLGGLRRDRWVRFGGRLLWLGWPRRLDAGSGRLSRLGGLRGDRLPQIVQFHGPRPLQLLAVIVGDI
jgi:hypothetical protein